jgi:hypothetical protein
MRRLLNRSLWSRLGIRCRPATMLYGAATIGSGFPKATK